MIWSGRQYLITFIDDFSRYYVVYFLREKSDALTAFQDFLSLAENQTGQTLKVLCTDSGGEYVSRMFAEFCSTKGIVHQRTSPDTPQQNGVAERKNHTIMNAVRAFLHTSSLPPSFWGEALVTAVHVQNCLPHSSLEGKIPFELWHGTRANVGSFRRFGALAYALNKDATKLDARSIVVRTRL